MEKLRTFPLCEIGSSEWMLQHENLEKLNIQCHANAANNSDPFVLEALMTFDKLKVLIHELIAIELWRINVYPRIKVELAAKNATKLYFIVSSTYLSSFML